MNSDRFKEAKDSLDKEETRIRNIKAGIDPEQIQELERTRILLGFWERRVRNLQENSKVEPGVLTLHEFALKFIGN